MTDNKPMAAKARIAELEALIGAWAAWEAAIIMDPDCWEGVGRWYRDDAVFVVPQKHYDTMIALQSRRSTLVKSLSAESVTEVKDV